MKNIDPSKTLGFVIPAMAGIQLYKNAGFRIKFGMTAFALILLSAALWLPGVSLAAPAPVATKNIMVFGDSLSAGYGIEVAEGWPSLLQTELDRTRSGYKILNASISGETTLGGRQRIAKLLEQYHPVIVILELGANDGLRGFSTADIESNLDEILMQINQIHARTALVGMKLPPNYGEPYITQFQSMFPRLAAKRHVPLLPFLLDGVPAEQFQADYLHPTAASQPQIMRNVLQVLTPLLR